MNPRWTQLGPLLHEFQQLLAPQVQQLSVQEGSAGDLKSQSPALLRPGVYLLFDAKSVLKYVGSTASQPMIDRVRTYFSPKSRFPLVLGYIDVIPFEWEWCFLAPALELYLIQRIESHRALTGGEELLNKIGKFAGTREWSKLTYGAGPHRVQS